MTCTAGSARFSRRAKLGSHSGDLAERHEIPGKYDNHCLKIAGKINASPLTGFYIFFKRFGQCLFTFCGQNLPNATDVTRPSPISMIPINPERQTHHVRKKMTQEENDRGASPRRKE
jgi:hypothetical protein